MFYKVCKVIAKPIAHIFYRLKVTGKENEPMDGALLVCGNHISLVDPVFIGINLKRQIHFMAKVELFKNKIISKLLIKFGAYPVNRGKADLTAIKTTIKLLKSGKAVGIFPEGTRAKDDEMLEAKSGIAMFVYKTKATVLPIGVKCSGKVKLFKRIYINIGKPVKFEELDFGDGTGDDFKRVSEIIMTKIRELETTERHG